MKILQSLRKPYIGMFMSGIILFISCSSPSTNEEIYSLSVEDFSKIHISLIDEISEIITQEHNVDMNMLENMPNSFNDVNELKNYLRSANYEKSAELADLLLEVQKNTINFIKSNGELEQEQILHMIESQLTKDLNKNYSEKASKTDCYDQRWTAEENCNTAMAISYVALVASTFWTIGVGTAIGTAALLVNLHLCYENARSAWELCMQNS